MTIAAQSHQTPASPRRSGRTARRADRKEGAGKGPTEAIWPGIEGGRYKPLKDADVIAVADTALRILAEIGMRDATPRCVETLSAAGGQITDDGRLLFPREMSEAVLATAGRNFKLHAQNPNLDLDPSGTRIHLGTSGAAVHIVDSATRNVRSSRLDDLYNMARLANVLDNIHMFQRTVVACDVPDPFEMDLNTAYACLSGTAKPVGTSFGNAEHLKPAIDMMHMVAGGEDAFRARPFLCVSTCFVVPPLKFAGEALGVIEMCCDQGVPLKLVSAGQAGATSPAALAGAVALQTAEVLSGVIYANLLNPGHSALFGALPFVSDLRTGAMSGGSAEQGLLMAACAQMAQYFNIPCAVSAGMTDSKIPDFQAGYEKGYTELLSALAGANLIYEAAGMYGSLLACSLESFVLDNDLIGAVMRSARGIEVSEKTLSFQTVKDVCIDGPGHFLAHQQTMDLMQADYFYPLLGDRRTPQDWAENGSPDILELARERTAVLLSAPLPDHIPADVDRAIRDRFPIHVRERI